ncbi:glycosyltransferase family 2 protein [Candidatus Woesearchaeota archaeon]|nr:glycosyltransferase family 2 protein [Candidatus Woesearchaeota archaeon]
MYNITAIIPISDLEDKKLRNFIFTLNNIIKSKIDQIIILERTNKTDSSAYRFIKKLNHSRIRYIQNNTIDKLSINPIIDSINTDYIWMINPDLFIPYNKILEKISNQEFIIPFKNIIDLNEKQTKQLINDGKIDILKNKENNDLFNSGSLIIKKPLYLYIGKTEEGKIPIYNGFKKREFEIKVKRCCDKIDILDFKGIKLYNKEKYKKISFCIPCMGRLEHLKKTLPKNIENNMRYPHIEFVLLDYNSQDGLEEWVKKNMLAYIKKGILVYYKTFDPKRFHMSHAKNMTHRLATGDILCNLDADNFLDKDFAFLINEKFNKYTMIAGDDSKNDLRWNKFCKGIGINPDNTFVWGMLCIKKEHFYEFDGYDESFLPYGHEEVDLYKRIRKGYDIKKDRIFIKKIRNRVKHSDRERLENMELGRNPRDKHILSEMNVAKAFENLKNHRLRINNGKFGCGIVYGNFDYKKKIVLK